MALTKLPKNAIGTGAVKANNIADGTIQNTDISGSIGADQLSSTLDLSSTSVTLASGEISNAELANSSFTLNGSSVSLGGSTSIIPYLNWQAVQVADGSTQVNAEVNKGYFLDTNAGVIEVFLPTSPTRGDVVGLVDYAGTFGTNQLIINTGGINIDSTVGSEFKVTTNNAIVECVYVDSAKGWLMYLNQAAGTTPDAISTAYGYDVQNTYITATGGTITTSTDYKIHTFTGDGCFVVSAGAGPFATVDYLVIAGGGGGATENYTGGAGAGGYRESHSVPVSGCYTASPLATPVGLSMSLGTYPITVGGGGSNSPGSNSIFSTITSAGGGGGNAGPVGNSGGSGEGGSYGNSGGAGNTPPVSPPQGNPGGRGQYSGGGSPASTGGGGGAGGAGTSPWPSGGNSGPGGPGVASSITGSAVTRAGGGGGAGGFGGASPGSGGPGGGGDGGGQGGAGAANTGSGGGGDGDGGDGGAGGKGIVIIRYKFQ